MPPPAAAGRAATHPPRTAKPITWTRSRVRRTCDECTHLAYTAGQWLPCHPATHQRATPNDTRYLCWTHAATQHEADGFGALHR